MKLFAFSIPEESNFFLRRIRSHFHSKLPLCTVHCGVGEEFFAARLEKYLTSHPEATAMVHAGFCGGLHPQLPVGSIVRAHTPRCNFTESAPESRPGNEALNSATVITVSGSWNSIGTPFPSKKQSPAEPPKSSRSLLSEISGQLIQVRSVVDSVARKAELAARFPGALAADMESAVTGRFGLSGKCPVRIVKSVSDSYSDSLPAPGALLFDLRRQRPMYFQLMQHWLTHPQDVIRLLAFIRSLRLAGSALADALMEEIEC